MDPVIDSTKEMDPASEEFKAMLVGIQADKPVEPKKDDKPKEPASSADGKTPVVDKPAPKEDKVVDKIDDEGGEEETLDKLKERVSGLKKELARREGNSQRVQELEKELAASKARLEERKEREVEQSTDDKVKTAIKKLDDDQLFSTRAEFVDEIGDARAAYREADRSGDTEARAEANQRVLRARNLLSQLDREVLDRAKASVKGQSDKERDEKEFAAEVDNLFNGVFDAVPAVKDKESELWKAGDVEFRKYPKLMSQLGPIGELVAMSLAIVRNPVLVGSKAAPADPGARKKVVKEIEDITHKTLLAGTSGSGKPVTSYEGVITGAQPLGDFEALVDKIKNG